MVRYRRRGFYGSATQRWTYIRDGRASRASPGPELLWRGDGPGTSSSFPRWRWTGRKGRLRRLDSGPLQPRT